MDNQKHKNMDYKAPIIERVPLDSNISLQLESPPIFPGENHFGQNSVPDYFNTDPFKNNFG